MRKKKNALKFFHLSTSDGEDWATEIEPISAVRAKKCMSCDRTTGVFFRDCSPTWTLANPLAIRHFSPTVQCYPCWLANDGPFFVINRKGQTVKPYCETIILAKDRAEVLELCRLWKTGWKLNKEVGTDYGTVVVLALPENKPEAENYAMKCPHCDRLIALSVAVAP